MYPEALEWYPYGANARTQYVYAIHLFILAGVNARDISVVYTKKDGDAFSGNVFLQKNKPTVKHLYVHFLYDFLFHMPIPGKSRATTQVNTPFHITTSNNELKLGGFFVGSTGEELHAISGFQSDLGVQYLYNGHKNLAIEGAYPCAPYQKDWLEFFNGEKYYIGYRVDSKCGISKKGDEPLADFERAHMFTYPFTDCGFFGMGIVDNVKPSRYELAIANPDASDSIVDVDDADSVKSYMINFDKSIVESITSIIQAKPSDHLNALNAIHKLLSPSLTFFDVREYHGGVYINLSIDMSLKSCIQIIVWNLLKFACDFAMNGTIPDAHIIDKRMRDALDAIIDNTYSIHVMDAIIYLACTKYQESHKFFRYTLPTNFTFEEVTSSMVSNNNDAIVHTIFTATKPLYLPASIANGYAKYHGKSTSVLIEWVEKSNQIPRKIQDVHKHVANVVTVVGTIFRGPPNDKQ
jgi:hypothetical protein